MGSATAQRQILLTREAAFFRLAFRYSESLVEVVRALPYAEFDGSSAWTCLVSAQSVSALRQMHRQGLCDVAPDALLEAGEVLPHVREATLRPGTTARPYLVRLATRDDRLHAKYKSILGARWERNARSMSYPPGAAAALAELVDRGSLDDPDQVLMPYGVTVVFDARTGRFNVRGDRRAAQAFEERFPDVDVMAIWGERNLDVGFVDDLSAEVYRGELARHGPGIQPAGMCLELFEHQRVDVAVLIERTGMGLFHSVGVGKTGSALGAAQELMVNRKAVSRTVIIVPGAVRTQWRSEILRFCGPDPDDIVIIDGDPAARAAAFKRALDTPWTILHYEIARLEADRKAFLKLATGALVIADEVHRLRNHTTKTHKVMADVARRAERRIGMSGTPAENHPGEWYSVLSGFAIPGLFGSPKDFLGRYSFPAKFGGYEGSRHLPDLRQRSAPHIMRRTLREVAPHIPRPRVQTVVLDPDPDYAGVLRRAHTEAGREIAQQRLERAQRAAARRGAELDDADLANIASGSEMTAVGMLKLLCCSPRIVAESEAPAAVALRSAGIIPDKDGPKLDKLRTIALEAAANRDRFVVFTSSARMAELISTRLTEDGVRHVLYTGKTSRKARDEAVAAFTTPDTDDEPGPTVYVSTDAGAEGLNLGACCSMLVNFDIPWTPGRLEQRNGRVRRINSTAASFLVINLILRRTAEHGFIKLVERKVDLSDALFGETDGRANTTGTIVVDFGAALEAADEPDDTGDPQELTLDLAA